METITINDLRIPDDQTPDPQRGLLSVLNRTGDARFGWDPNRTAEVDSIRRQFDDLIGKGYLAYKTRDGRKTNEQIREFDPSLGEIVMSPPMAGG